MIDEIEQEHFPETNVHIKFEVTAQTGVNVKFEGEVSLIGLRDWFDRAALGVATVFNPTGSTVLKCTESGAQKINAIKIVRMHTNCSLRDGKDFIEGTLNLKLDSFLKAKAMAKELEAIGAIVVSASSTNEVPLTVTRV